MTIWVLVLVGSKIRFTSSPDQLKYNRYQIYLDLLLRDSTLLRNLFLRLSAFSLLEKIVSIKISL